MRVVLDPDPAYDPPFVWTLSEGARRLTIPAIGKSYAPSGETMMVELDGEETEVQVWKQVE